VLTAWKIISTVCLGFACAIPPCSAIDLMALQLYNQGVEASAAGNTPTAIKLFERALKLDSRLSDAHYNLGVCYYDNKQFDKAAQSFQKVLQLQPRDPQAQTNYQRAMLKAGITKVVNQPTQAVYGGQLPRTTSPIIQLGDNDRLTKPTWVANPKPMARFVPPSLKRKPVAVYTGGQLPAASMVYGNTNVRLKAITPNAKPALALTPKTPTGHVGWHKAQVISVGHGGPTGIVPGPDNALYVASFLKNVVYRVPAEGGSKAVLTAQGLSGPVGMVWNPTRQEWYVANYKSNTVARILPSGQVSTLTANLHKPYMLMLDMPKQTLYVTEQDTNAVSRIKL
jgi:DNA-binding beta-propeller fold protein YncE